MISAATFSLCTLYLGAVHLADAIRRYVFTLHSALKKSPHCKICSGADLLYLKVFTVSFTVVGLALAALPSGVMSR